MGKGKKGKKKEDDNWEDDLAEIAKESGIQLNEGENVEDFTQNIPKKKEKKKKGKAVEEREDGADTEIVEAGTKKKAKPSFDALMLEDDDMLGNDEDSSEDEIAFEKEANKEKIESVKDEAGKKGKAKKGKEKKGKKKKEIDDEEEDLDAILADIESNDAGKKEGKKGKKKGNQKHAEVTDELTTDDLNEEEVAEVTAKEEDKEESKGETEVKATAVEVDEDEGPKVKTAAQKRAEKKEREKEKKKKEAEKKKGKTTETKEEEKGEDVKSDIIKESTVVKSDTSKESTGQESTPAEAAGSVDIEHEEGSGDEGETEEGDKKKKKKKKKKGKEDDEKKKTKKPGKAAIKQMQEALENLKLEEERLRQEEEAKQKALEEAENQRLEKAIKEAENQKLEKIRLEKERKEKKKQKEKERKEKLKKEGKLLTPAQREQKRRAEMMLEAMKQQGITVPSKDAVEQRKKVQYGKKKKNPKLQSQTSQNSEDSSRENASVDEDKQIEEPKIEEAIVKPEAEDEKTEEAETEDLPDSWECHDDDEAQSEKTDDKVKEKSDTESKKKTGVKNETADLESSKAAESTDKDAKNEGDESDESGESDSDESGDESGDEESSDEESESDSEHEKLTPEKIKETARERIMKRRVAAEAKRSVDNLRCPVICVLGHVDTGKTKILDKIRHTNVQDGEAGGITQQIGATMVPVDTVKVQTKMIKDFQKFDLNLPGLLIIDTPGHESFSNLRTRGSSLCDMAILVVDIMHGLEPQTIESINLLRKKHTPFLVALNKIDRLFEWKRGPSSQVEDTIKKQKKNTKMEFEDRVRHVVGEFAEQGLNAKLFFENIDEKNFISLVPTSAHSGDGMGDLMALICRLTQTRLSKKLAFSEEVESTVMEVKSLPGLGTTVDTILVNGKLREGDTIVTGGLEGPVVTQIRAILTPQPLRELRVKSNYIQHKELYAAQGCKITGKDLEKVMAGAPVFVAEHPDEIEVLKDEVTEIVRSSLKAIKLSERGVYVQASTLGSLEALLEFLKTSKIPYSGVNIGPVHKKDVMKTSVMLEHEPLYAAILAFDVKIERDAQDLADKEGIKIFAADIIYHLFDKFTAYTEDYKQKLKDKHKHLAIFPCKLRVMPQHIFNSRDPIVIGMHVEAGTVRLGTPLTVPSKEFCDIGIVTGIEANHKNMDKAVTGQEICVKIEKTGDAPKMYGRHFTHEDMVTSKISRESIDALKDYFRDEMSKNDWQLIIELKKLFEIM